MSRLMRFKWLWITALVVGGLWFFAGRLLMEFEWRDLDLDGTDVADIRRDLAAGRTGPVLKTDPCMMHKATIDIDLVLDGPFPLRTSDALVMEVFILSDTLMVDRLFLGPPTRRLTLPAMPVCLSGPNLPQDDQDAAAYGRVIVYFTDLENRRFLVYSGEEAFPILAWRTARIQWATIPWYMERGESYSQIMVTPL
jgi:hypothetical protein